LNEAFVYDFDGTLVDTDKALTVYYLWGYVESLYEEPDTENHMGFKIADHAEVLPLWSKVEETFQYADNYILSGRNQTQIEYWLKKNGLDHLFIKVIGLGSRSKVPELKHKFLLDLSRQYDLITFYDDKTKCLQAASKIRNVIPVKA
jgi:phosphoglycolate phosphatase-like HAD superfamily hydrolase